MADVTVGVLTRWDKVLGETFPHETGWDTPYAGDHSRVLNDGRRFTVSGFYEDPTVITDGARSPFRNTWLAAPPKYPHGRHDSAEFTPSMVATVEAHGAYIVAVVEGDPADIPPGFENMTRNDPIEPTTKWPELRAAYIAMCDEPEQQDQVTALLDGWWSDTEELGTFKELDTLMRRFTT